MAAPAARIERLAITDSHRQSIDVFYRLTDGTLMAARADARSGHLVGRYELEPATPFTGAAMRWVYKLHEQFNLADRGEILVGISGLLALSAALSGIWLGWPARRQWKATFAVRRWRKLDHRLYGWHRAIGLLVSVGLVIITVTGASMVFSGVTRSAIASATTFRPVYSPMQHGNGGASISSSVGDITMTPQRAVDIAQARLPSGTWVRVFPPTTKSTVYVVRLYLPGESRKFIGATSVAIDAHNGRILDVYEAPSAPLGNRIVDALYPIHDGEIFGLLGRLLVMCAGLALPTLYITSITLWWRKRRARLQRSAERGAPVAKT